MAESIGLTLPYEYGEPTLEKKSAIDFGLVRAAEITEALQSDDPEIRRRGFDRLLMDGAVDSSS